MISEYNLSNHYVASDTCPGGSSTRLLSDSPTSPVYSRPVQDDGQLSHKLSTIGELGKLNVQDRTNKLYSSSSKANISRRKARVDYLTTSPARSGRNESMHALFARVQSSPRAPPSQQSTICSRIGPDLLQMSTNVQPPHAGIENQIRPRYIERNCHSITGKAKVPGQTCGHDGIPSRSSSDEWTGDEDFLDDNNSERLTNTTKSNSQTNTLLESPVPLSNDLPAGQPDVLWNDSMEAASPHTPVTKSSHSNDGDVEDEVEDLRTLSPEVELARGSARRRHNANTNGVSSRISCGSSAKRQRCVSYYDDDIIIPYRASTFEPL